LIEISIDLWIKIIKIAITIGIAIPALGWFWLGYKEAKDLFKVILSKIMSK